MEAGEVEEMEEEEALTLQTARSPAGAMEVGAMAPTRAVARSGYRNIRVSGGDNA